MKLNKIPMAIEGSKLKIWECYKCKTGTTNWTTWLPQNPENLFNGPSGSAWSVSGMPMSMIPVTNSTASNGAGPPPLTDMTEPAALNSHYTETIARWLYNPWVENAKYFSKGSVGGIPAQFGDNNSTTVLLTDENGWGIMCPNQEVFLTSCDFATQQHGSQPFVTFQFPRYFTLYFRQRYVKSPVVLADIFEDYALKQVAGYKGETDNIMEVELQMGRDPNEPEGMLDSDGVRNPVNTTGGTVAGSMFKLPSLYQAPKKTTTARSSKKPPFIDSGPTLFTGKGAPPSTAASQTGPPQDHPPVSSAAGSGNK